MFSSPSGAKRKIPSYKCANAGEAKQERRKKEAKRIRTTRFEQKERNRKNEQETEQNITTSKPPLENKYAFICSKTAGIRDL
jgi:hypothetical protein